jgi:hypothetical protein
MARFGLAVQTMFAELTQRCLDAEFDETYDERGAFVKRKRDSRMYWYYRQRQGDAIRDVYVGPVTDKSITDRVKRFSEIKDDYKQRREMVRALVAARLPEPDAMTGDLTERLWKGGFFRLRGVLVGTVAYQCYSGLLGARLPQQSLMTHDPDAAQFYSISHAIGESIPPIEGLLKQVDATFRALPDRTDPARVWRFRNKHGYLVEFLTPNRGSDEYDSRPADMPALGGASARTLRHLDFLIHRPTRSVMLYKAGIAVTVPTPWRYAVHKLMIAGERSEGEKTEKDMIQAEQLIVACLDARRAYDLHEAWNEAYQRGPRWKEKLERGVAALQPGVRARFQDEIVKLRAEPQSRRGSRH